MNAERWDTDMILRLENSALQWSILGSADLDDNDGSAAYQIVLDDNEQKTLELSSGSKTYGEGEDEENFHNEFAEHSLHLSDVWSDINLDLPPFLKQIDQSTFEITLVDLRRLAKEQDVELGLSIAGHKAPRTPAQAVEALLGENDLDSLRSELRRLDHNGYLTLDDDELNDPEVLRAAIAHVKQGDATPGQRFSDFAVWKQNAKSRGLHVRTGTHPNGNVDSYSTAKDAEGNERGHFDHEIRKGQLSEAGSGFAVYRPGRDVYVWPSFFEDGDRSFWRVHVGITPLEAPHRAFNARKLNDALKSITDGTNVVMFEPNFSSPHKSQGGLRLNTLSGALGAKQDDGGGEALLSKVKAAIQGAGFSVKDRQ